MRHFLITALLFITILASAQPRPEMTPQGFAPVEFPAPNKTFEKIVELSKSWAASYDKKRKADVFDVTANSLLIQGWNEYAFFYRNIGVRYDYNIIYTMKVTFLEDKRYTITFAVKEIYAEDVLTKMTIASFFTPDGKLKDDYTEVKPSLESRVETILKSYSNFIAK